MKRKTLSEVQISTIVRLIVLIVAVVNLLLSSFTDFRLPGLDATKQQATATILAAIASVVSYWYNNSWTENATAADKILDTLKNSDVKVEDVLESIEILEASLNSRSDDIYDS